MFGSKRRERKKQERQELINKHAREVIKLADAGRSTVHYTKMLAFYHDYSFQEEVMLRVSELEPDVLWVGYTDE